jgi:hypothetical protein
MTRRLKMNMNVVQVEQKSVYGVVKFYPHNDLAFGMAEFKGQKTLTQSDIKMLKEMGFQVELMAAVPGKLVGVKLGDL